MAKLYFYYSAMNAGKSTTLIQSAYNYAERGMRALLFTLGGSEEEKETLIVSRIGIEAPARSFFAATDFLQVVKAETEKEPVHCVLVDEAQFLSRTQVYQLTEVVDELSIPVLCYGIRTDFRGELFTGSSCLLAWADVLTELKTICFCGRKANFVIRLGPAGEVAHDGAQIEIGGNEKYISLCRRHFKEKMGGWPSC